MVDSAKVTATMKIWSEEVLEHLGKEIEDLKKKSVAVRFDKTLTKHLSDKASE